MKALKIVPAVLLFAACISVFAQPPAQPSSPQLEHRFKALIAELRCLVCQNQSLADSNADLAVDMRREILQMMEKGAGDDEIVDFLVARYGDFVRYRPPVKSTTILLWFGPLLLLILGLIVATLAIRRHRALQPDVLQSSQRERVRAMLDDADPDRDR